MTILKDLVARTPRVVSIQPTATVREAAQAMVDANVGCAAIMEGERLSGLFTERDLLKRVLLKDMDIDEVKVTEVMSKELVVVRADDNIPLAANLMQEHHIRHLPVVYEDGGLLGVLSIRDLLRTEVQEMRDYIAQREG